MTDALERRIVRDAVTLDRSGIAAGRALHSAVGVAAPLAIGVAAGRVLEGVAVAGGALMVGFADLGSPYRVRTQVMLTASIAMAFSSFVGLIGGRHDWLAVLLMGVWGLIAGLSVALGQVPAFLGLLSGLALLLAEDVPTDVREALRRAALVLAGGLLQTLLAVMVWPVRATAPERTALAAECHALADVAGAWPDSRPSRAFIQSACSAETMLAAHRAWAAGGSTVGETFRRLADELDRTYGELFALRAERERLASGARAQVDAAVAEVTRTLHAVARALRHAHDRVAGEHASSVSREPLPESSGQRVEALRARLRALVALVGSLGHRTAGGRRPRETEHRRAPAAPSPNSTALPILRANLTFRSTAFRHGLRLGVTLAVAVAIYRLLPLGRGYWVPLTVIFVLKPDFGSTFTRGLQRYAGTAVGVVLATLLAVALASSDWVDTILIGAFAWATYAFFFANYAIFTASTTALIVFFVAFEDVKTYTAVVDRLIDTAIGGALALGAFALWPTWESRRDVAANVAALLEADRSFLAAVLEGAETPTAAGREAVRRARSAARLARSNAEASLERALAEPERERGDVTAIAGVLLASRSLAAAMLAIDARLLDEPARVPARAVAPLADRLDAALAELASAARDQRSPIAFPQLGAGQEALAAAAPAWLARETAEVIDSLETMSHLLVDVAERQSPAREPAQVS